MANGVNAKFANADDVSDENPLLLGQFNRQTTEEELGNMQFVLCVLGQAERLFFYRYRPGYVDTDFGFNYYDDPESQVCGLMLGEDRRSLYMTWLDDRIWVLSNPVDTRHCWEWSDLQAPTKIVGMPGLDKQDDISPFVVQTNSNQITLSEFTALSYTGVGYDVANFKSVTPQLVDGENSQTFSTEIYLNALQDFIKMHCDLGNMTVLKSDEEIPRGPETPLGVTQQLDLTTGELTDWSPE